MEKHNRILHVDNDPETLTAVKALLQKEGFRADTAINGFEALEKIKTDNIDLILLDVMMPELSGWDVFTRLMKMKKHVPKVIFLTVLEVSKERMAALKKAGIADYITKPFDNEDLVKRIRKILKD